ncbi:MAG: hypothetical protein Q8P52_00615 [bacterium]|nr:hypothetical protein [bacterium]
MNTDLWLLLISIAGISLLIFLKHREVEKDISYRPFRQARRSLDRAIVNLLAWAGMILREIFHLKRVFLASFSHRYGKLVSLVSDKISGFLEKLHERFRKRKMKDNQNHHGSFFLKHILDHKKNLE